MANENELFSKKPTILSVGVTNQNELTLELRKWDTTFQK
jgi:hypothetical protein